MLYDHKDMKQPKKDTEQDAKLEQIDTEPLHCD